MAHRWHIVAKTNNTERGYDSEHRRERKKRAAEHHPADPCSRCGHALGPMGPWLHLDHSPDRSTWLGFAHGSRPCPVCGRKCNLRAGAQVGRARQGGTNRQANRQAGTAGTLRY